MTAAQRLRLVLALGAINLVLASVALAVGIVGVQSPSTTAGGPTPGIAFVSPAPTATTTVPEPTPASSPEPGTSTPGTARPDDHAGRRADSDRAGCIPVRRAVADRRADARAGPHAASRRPGRRRPRSSARRGTRRDADARRWRSRPTRPAPSKHPAKPPQGQASRQEAAQAAPHSPHADRPDHGQQAASRQVEPRTQVRGADCASVAARARLPSRADVNGSARSSRRGLHGAIGSSSDEVRPR